MKNNQNNDSVIVVNNVKKTFRLPHESHSGLKQVLLNIGRKNHKKGFETQSVLKGVSFEVKKGDFFGIVGRNGSGKSTLLKMLAGIYTPDSGSIETYGTLVPFIELGVGFNPELTGRENIFLNGALLGFSKKETEEMYDEIVEFAELHKFMDQKLKNYSSGMQVRLAFSIAIKAQGDILVLDEVLAVGDEAFQRKCNSFFNDIKKDKTKTVILVTHDMGAVRKYCNKAIMIQDGEIVSSGSPSEVSNEYSLENGIRNDTGGSNLQSGELAKLVPKFEVTRTSSPNLNEDDYFECQLSYEITENVPVRFGISIMDTKSNYPVMNDWIKDTDGSRKIVSKKAGEYTYTYRWKVHGINTKELTFIATLYRVDTQDAIPIAFIPLDKGASFIVNHNGKNNALLDQEGEWKLLK